MGYVRIVVPFECHQVALLHRHRVRYDYSEVIIVSGDGICDFTSVVDIAGHSAGRQVLHRVVVGRRADLWTLVLRKLESS